MKIPLRLVGVLSLSGLLNGCVVWVEDLADLKQFVSQARSQPSGRIEPLPEYKPYENFVYHGVSLREPFRALTPLQPEVLEEQPKQVASTLQPDQQREKGYLESFSLDDLNMVGTIRKGGKGQFVALVRDQNGAVHRVVVGDYIGLDYGEVRKIDNDKVELREIVDNGRGGWMRRSRNLVLDTRN
ncbi:pilus assembly protein PilP [Marinobacterium jannaschii]|uniref:pilus assembly protein PilP n=1 Tax=Marinobacterium jannaschii TaxID=64970 RepID=UPI000488CCCB|nr:pilus assembly protein PilP [Marinobacterium jannaschii]